MLNEILFLALAFVVSIVSVTFGFGSAIILIPFSSFLLPIKQAIAIITIAFIAGNISKIVLYRKHIDWKITLLIWAGGVPLVLLGANLMAYAPTAVIKTILGAAILLYLVVDYFKISERIKFSNKGVVVIGGINGFLSGLIGTSGTTKELLLTHLGLRKEKFIATAGMSAILINLIKISIYSQFNLISYSDTPLVVGLILCTFAGAYFGRNIVKRIQPSTFKKVVGVMSIIVSLKLFMF